VQQLLLAIPILLFSMVAHEYAHGYAALRQGDDTAYALGRLTFNPIKHIDPFMTIMLPIMLAVVTKGQMIFGGAKPVPVNPRNYRNYRRGDIIVSAAGIVTNLGLALICFVLALVVGIVGGALGGGGAAALIQQVLFWGIWLNLLLAFFNIVPIPPLDGSHILYHLLPPRLGAQYRALSRYGLLILVALLWFVPGTFSVLLAPAFYLYHLAAVGLGPHVLGTLPLL
jgi:Zn-dependent protease